MARKGENIYKRKDGRWEGRCRTGRLSGGKAGYISVYGKSYREVKEKLFVKKGEQLAGKKAGGRLPAGITVGEAVDLWIEERKGGWKESTLATYRSIAENIFYQNWEELRWRRWMGSCIRDILKNTEYGGTEAACQKDICTRYIFYSDRYSGCWRKNIIAGCRSFPHLVLL